MRLTRAFRFLDRNHQSVLKSSVWAVAYCCHQFLRQFDVFNFVDGRVTNVSRLGRFNAVLASRQVVAVAGNLNPFLKSDVPHADQLLSNTDSAGIIILALRGQFNIRSRWMASSPPLRPKSRWYGAASHLVTDRCYPVGLSGWPATRPFWSQRAGRDTCGAGIEPAGSRRTVSSATARSRFASSSTRRAMWRELVSHRRPGPSTGLRWAATGRCWPDSLSAAPTCRTSQNERPRGKSPSTAPAEQPSTPQSVTSGPRGCMRQVPPACSPHPKEGGLDGMRRFGPAWLWKRMSQSLSIAKPVAVP